MKKRSSCEGDEAKLKLINHFSLVFSLFSSSFARTSHLDVSAQALIMSTINIHKFVLMKCVYERLFLRLWDTPGAFLSFFLLKLSITIMITSSYDEGEYEEQNESYEREKNPFHSNDIKWIRFLQHNFQNISLSYAHYNRFHKYFRYPFAFTSILFNSCFSCSVNYPKKVVIFAFISCFRVSFNPLWYISVFLIL